MLLEKTWMEDNRFWEIRLFGDIDLYNVDQLKQGLEGLNGESVHLICDQLKYLDSTGLGVLVSLLKQTREKGNSVRITGLAPHIFKIFRLTGLDNLFDIEVAQ